MQNQFANLPSESEVSTLAQVTCEEVYAQADSVETTPVLRPMTGSKLLRHNLRQPIDKRISRASLESKRAFARVRGNIMGLWGTIHAECEPLRQSFRDKDAMIADL